MNRLAIYFMITIFCLPIVSWADEVSPRDVYKVASGVIENLNDIRNAKQIYTPIEATVRDGSKTPTDVYHRVYVLLEKLQKLTLAPGYEVDKKITLPKRKTGRMIPEDVMELLLEAQKIIYQIRKTSNLKHAAYDLPRYSPQI